jgi:uncharacterized protein (AIM24 family)
MTPPLGAPRGLEVELPLDGAPQGRKGEAADSVAPSAPMPLALFVEKRELRPAANDVSGANGPFTLAGELLVVRVDGRVPVRTAGALASSGKLAYAPLLRRVRGKAGEEPFGEGEDAMVVASGSGVIVVSPRGSRFTALALGDKDALYLREASVFAFEESLSWENGRIPGAGPQGLVIVQFRGQGRVVLRSKKAPCTLKIAPGDVLYVDQEALLGWIGQVVPQQLRGVDGEPTQFVACSGEGALLLEEPPPPEVPIPLTQPA